LNFWNRIKEQEEPKILTMRIISLIKALPVLILILIYSCPVSSQAVVEKSKDKVIIAGVPYYVHQVKKSETLYSIAKTYGVTVEQLNHENPPAVYGLKDGQTLRIPVTTITASTSAAPPAGKAHDNSKYVYHVLKPGETVYSLSKVYGVSENEIIQSNQGIDITKLSVGTEIAVPKRELMSKQQEFDDDEDEDADQDGNYIMHKVQKGETLSSIARQYGITLRKLKRANKDVKFPQVGDFLKIPGVKKEEPAAIKPVITDTVTPVIEKAPPKFERTAGFTMVKDLKGTMNVAVLLPFYLPQNAKRVDIDSSKIVKGKRTYKVNKVTDEWIYPGSLDFVEMYQGILLAADTLRSLGLNIILHTYDIKSDTVEISRLISSGKLAGMDLIIGPVYSNNLPIVSRYAGTHGIPVVSPVPLMNNSALKKNPTLFMASSSLEITQKALARKISEYSDNNIVFIHTDSTNADVDVNRFKNLIISELSYKTDYNDIKFREFRFYSRSQFNNDSINRLSHALSDQSDNIVIIASEEAPVISEAIDQVSSLSRKYSIKLFGYPVIRDLDRLDQKVLFDMSVMLYSPYWIDYSRNTVKQFNADFRRAFNTQPLERSYAWQGYDIAYYFMSGLAMHGTNFIVHPEMHYPELLQTDYDFRRNNSGDGFENLRLFLIHYTKNYDVLLEDDK
jgi:LysM repeat protein/ABC-type branched-subunit amino acid transport system substrate-binding protein